MRRRAPLQSGLQLVVRPERAEASLWRRFRSTGQWKLREHLFNRYRRFASTLARRHARRNNVARDVLDDLEQFAYRGLLEAIDRYDPLRRVPFVAFATARIAGSMVDGLGRLDERGAQMRFRRRIERERMASLAASDGSPPAARDSATARLGDLVTELALGLMLECEERATAASLSDQAHNGFDNLAWRQTQALLHQRVEELPEAERMVIQQHYRHDLPFARIAELAQLSRGRVSQLHKSALTKLRKSMRSVR